MKNQQTQKQKLKKKKKQTIEWERLMKRKHLKDIGESENLGEGEERRVRGGFDEHGSEGCGVGGSRGLLHELIDQLRLLLLDVHCERTT